MSIPLRVQLPIHGYAHLFKCTKCRSEEGQLEISGFLHPKKDDWTIRKDPNGWKIFYSIIHRNENSDSIWRQTWHALPLWTRKNSEIWTLSYQPIPPSEESIAPCEEPKVNLADVNHRCPTVDSVTKAFEAVSFKKRKAED